MVIPILETGDAGNLDDSGIAHDLAKLDFMPEGIVECGPVNETGTAEELEVERYYTCPWSLRRDARAYFLGFSQSADVNLFHVIQRVIPAQDPERPWLYASRCDLVECCGAPLQDSANYALNAQGQPFEEEEGQANTRVLLPAIAYADNRGASGVNPDDWQKPSQGMFDGIARLKVVYTSRRYRIKNDDQAAKFPELGELCRYVERTLNPNIEAIPLVRLAERGPNQLRFFEGPPGDEGTPAQPGRVKGQIIPEAGIQLLQTAQLTYMWHEVPDVPWLTIFQCLGHVNSLAFDGAPGFPTYDPGTLLYLQPRVFEIRNAVGRVSWNIIHNFSFRESGWNSFPSAGGLGFFGASFGGKPDGPKVYPTENFFKLFKAGPPIDYD